MYQDQAGHIISRSRTVQAASKYGSEKAVGKSVRRKENFRLIQGKGIYAGNVQAIGAVALAVLRSPHAHARIPSIDSSAARNLPGVLAVVTGVEFNAAFATQPPAAGVREHMKVVSRWPMAADTSRYEGEPVAVVVAGDAYVARDALELIVVDHQRLPAVVDCERPLEDGAPLVHDDLGTNLCVNSSRTVVEPDAAFAEADGVLNFRLVEPRLVPDAMEPRSATARYDRGVGELTLRLSMPRTWNAEPPPVCWAWPRAASACSPEAWAASASR